MKRWLMAVAMLVVATGAFAGRGNSSVSIDFDDDSTSCDDGMVRFNNHRAAIAKEEVPVAGLRTLNVRGEHAGIRVTGTNSGTYKVTVCKAAALAADLNDVRVALRGNEITADGPNDGQWMIFYFIEMPRGADLNVDSQNGPVSIRGVDGSVVARATNGPLSVKDSRGHIDAKSVNGPISVSGSSGNVKLVTSNGPLAVRLDGARWEGGNLEASTTNGPLTLRIPRNYASGVTVEASGAGPISCHADACGDSRRMSRFDNDDDDSPRTIELGSGARNVRLSTVNGPLVIKDE
ncbi:MAG TPA: hypothetical protein VFN10_06760 [Thermoanaerobaculia bacterium]|nr:hypothetical protein [Thermoanaerobaculia bacterium]